MLSRCELLNREYGIVPPPSDEQYSPAGTFIAYDFVGDAVCAF